MVMSKLLRNRGHIFTSIDKYEAGLTMVPTSAELCCCQFVYYLLIHLLFQITLSSKFSRKNQSD